MSVIVPARALVIGSEGNIGSRLVDYLRAAGYDVMEADIRPRWRDAYLMADVNNPLDLLPAFDWRPDVVFVLAAAVGRMTCEQAGSLAVATNLGGLNNVLQLCKRANSMCVYTSSSEVYGPECDPMDDAASLPRPNNRYGLSKWLGEQLVEYEARRCGLRAVTVRLCMVYDEEEDLGEHRSAMIRFAANLARGRPIEVHRGSVRGWMHVLDAVRALEAASRVTEYMAINIGSPHLLRMTDLADMMCAELGADRSLLAMTDLPAQMTLVKRLTLDRQRSVLGVEPQVSIEEGVRRVCAHQARLVHMEAFAPSIPRVYSNGVYPASLPSAVA
jgi:nucleoside-diphosphate-sugar epimerase